jgi:hypothetical protein
MDELLELIDSESKTGNLRQIKNIINNIQISLNEQKLIIRHSVKNNRLDILNFLEDKFNFSFDRRSLSLLTTNMDIIRFLMNIEFSYSDILETLIFQVENNDSTHVEFLLQQLPVLSELDDTPSLLESDFKKLYELAEEDSENLLLLQEYGTQMEYGIDI